jgi:zinc D-Ala-D-Ala carboxypeptidase
MKMRNFNLKEFDSPDLEGSGLNMDKDFLSMLDNARDIAKTPFKITSGYRTKEHNVAIYKKLGKKPIESSHLKGVACDIACSDSRARFLIINALLEAGFTRIGIANNFIHVDSDCEKSQNVIWTY